MTTRPRLRTDFAAYALLGVALFVVFSAVFLTAGFPEPEGFAGVSSITAAIGYAMFDIQADVVPEGTESFLVAFILIALVLDAALDGAVMLARREEGPVLPITDGGWSLRDDADETSDDDESGGS